MKKSFCEEIVKFIRSYALLLILAICWVVYLVYFWIEIKNDFITSVNMVIHYKEVFIPLISSLFGAGVSYYFMIRKEKNTARDNNNLALMTIKNKIVILNTSLDGYEENLNKELESLKSQKAEDRIKSFQRYYLLDKNFLIENDCLNRLYIKNFKIIYEYVFSYNCLIHSFNHKLQIKQEESIDSILSTQVNHTVTERDLNIAELKQSPEIREIYIRDCLNDLSKLRQRIKEIWQKLLLIDPKINKKGK
ncbi:hypothetical protein IBE20_07910 [Francisella tularensis subsp. novicida]|uniref:DUF4760 domain-containing protein n=2 Tax=Francisella tularensis TaxID=263 RepID=A0A6I4RXU3_FRATU|nr:hypothetical protein [Francisella tularensis]ABK89601.1 hypothetical protein FTN_0709 [Francisella tularensis subsp. novicida U112]AJI61289.1 hypothetical protein AW25_1314 [Francisella tularensis subsp. novicida U112]EDX19945.1 hypothetical protein FTE_1770 [Francisella tularensis subsp. novicida FTE]MBK2036626.1 hypothetical protein [Francisella tularensis subsp. novicida]MBK2117174.1 hypothetical protein [Francisella tularensis subsp. novicida]